MAAKSQTTVDARQARAGVVLAAMLGPGHHWLAAAIEQHGTAELLARLSAGVGESRIVARFQRRLAGRKITQVYRQLLVATASCGARIITPGHPEWPESFACLATLGDEEAGTAPPLCLWVRGKGSLRELTERSVAIVGARDATSYGVFASSELGYGLAQRGWSVVSGAAYGIDAAAHRGALAADGATIAVLACGVDIAYPRSSQQLLASIGETGLIISEYPPGAGVARHQFLVRNRLIAALCAGTVVVEAAKRSGSLLTARRATDLGRVVMALPGPVTSSLSVGTHGAIRDWGARLITSADDVVSEVASLSEYFSDAQENFSAAEHDATCPRSPHDDLDAVEARLVQALPTSGSMSVTMLSTQLGLSPTDVRRRLPSLVMRGVVAESEDGYRLGAAALERPARANPPSLR